MKKIDKKNFELTIYEYLKYIENTKRRIKGAGVITDKQSVFYSDIYENKIKSHIDIIIAIENEIHPNSKKYGWDNYYKNHTYIYSFGNGDLISISLPEDGNLSISQANLIYNTLDQINKYNQETKTKEIKIDLYSVYENYYGITDVELLKEKIKEYITKNITIEEETIIGTTLTKEELIEIHNIEQKNIRR